MSDDPLFTSLFASNRERRGRRLLRLWSFALAGFGYVSLIAGALLAHLLWVEAMPPPKALTGVPIIFHPPSGGGALPGGSGSTRASAPPAIRPPAPRPVVIPLPPPEEESVPSAGLRSMPGGAGDDAGLPGIGGPGDGAGQGGDGSGGDGTGCPGCAGPGSGIEPVEGFYREGAPGITPPILIASSRALPKYPDLARRAGVEGTVILLVVIDSEGRVGEIEVLRSPDPRFGFDLAAVEAVKQWRYRPALLGDRPVSVQASVMVEFTISR